MPGKHDMLGDSGMEPIYRKKLRGGSEDVHGNSDNEVSEKKASLNWLIQHHIHLYELCFVLTSDELLSIGIQPDDAAAWGHTIAISGVPPTRWQTFDDMDNDVGDKVRKWQEKQTAKPQEKKKRK
jgi:hypothetical protein